MTKYFGVDWWQWAFLIVVLLCIGLALVTVHWSYSVGINQPAPTRTPTDYLLPTIQAMQTDIAHKADKPR